MGAEMALADPRAVDSGKIVGAEAQAMNRPPMYPQDDAAIGADIERTLAVWVSEELTANELMQQLTGQSRRYACWDEVRGFMLVTARRDQTAAEIERLPIQQQLELPLPLARAA